VPTSKKNADPVNSLVVNTVVAAVSVLRIHFGTGINYKNVASYFLSILIAGALFYSSDRIVFLNCCYQDYSISIVKYPRASALSSK
jgi:hypothetical protein